MLFFTSLSVRLLVSCAATNHGDQSRPSGYLSSRPKVALVSAPGSSFVVKRASDGKTVLQGKLSAPATDQDTGDTVQAADFSSLKTTGNYYLEIAGVGRSWPFAIGPDVYSAPTISRCAASTDNAAARRSTWVRSLPTTNILRVI